MCPTALFDFDGVIVDSEPLHRETFLELLAPYGIQISRDEWFREYAGTGSRKIFERIIAERSLDADASDLVKRRGALFNSHLDSGRIAPMEGLTDLLSALSKSGWKMGIVSGGHRYYIEKLVDSLSIRRYFGAIVAADDIPERKPDPKVFLHGARLLDADPGSCVVIEDSYSGIEAGRGAGMRTIWIRPDRNMKSPDCDLIVDSLKELSPAILGSLLSR